MQLHTLIKNLDEYGKGQGERNSRTLSFCGGDDRPNWQKNQDSGSAAESDNADNADDR